MVVKREESGHVMRFDQRTAIAEVDLGRGHGVVYI